VNFSLTPAVTVQASSNLPGSGSAHDHQTACGRNFSPGALSPDMDFLKPGINLLTDGHKLTDASLEPDVPVLLESHFFWSFQQLAYNCSCVSRIYWY
jgi:hypothetical protein